jgi:hypothetical protein
LISFVWGYAAIATNNWLNNITKVTFIYSFLLTFSLTIPFDMRDATIDTFKTIPNTIGIGKSTYLSIAIYFLSTLPIYFLSLNIVAFLMILLIGVSILFFSKKYFQNNNYLAFVELIIPIQTLILSTTLL